MEPIRDSSAERIPGPSFELFFVDRLRYLYGLGFSDFIATTFPFNPILDPTPTEYDVHVYQSSSKTWNIPLIAKLYSKMHHDTAWMSENSFYYDDFQVCGVSTKDALSGLDSARSETGRSTSRASMPLPKTIKVCILRPQY